MEFTKSIQAFQEAQECIPGGVNSPVRSFKSVESDPVFIESAQGSKVRDIDGNEYIDYVGSWGPMILGHAHPRRTESIVRNHAEGHQFWRSYPAGKPKWQSKYER